jgi:uncharacterized membrane protein YphA (DoxX/SURF4 family)
MENKTVTMSHAIRPSFNLLRITFGIVPIVAGLDKFTNLLTNWEQYLNPAMAGMLPVSAHTFMIIVGIIEVIAGILVLVRPALGAFIVAAWLTLIAITLLAGGQFLDVAVRDLVMAVGAFTLGRISRNASHTDERNA